MYSNCKYENSIEKDIKTLSDDSFEGREAGTQVEKKQLNLLKQFQSGLEPKGVDGFFQYFNFNESSNLPTIIIKF